MRETKRERTNEVETAGEAEGDRGGKSQGGATERSVTHEPPRVLLTGHGFIEIFPRVYNTYSKVTK